MKVNVVFVCVFSLVCGSRPNVLFEDYLQQYNKTYRNNVTEYFVRYANFKANIEKSRLLNLNRTSDESAYYGATKFSDMSAEEFRKTYLSCFQETQHYKSQSVFASIASPLTNLNIPKKIDWRYNPKTACKEAITAVKNQKSCGACWAFATVETVESMHAIKTGNLRELSVQQMIDCSKGYDSLNGCAGGGTCLALQWMTDKHVALVTEKEYPTVDKPERCKLPPKVRQGISISNYTCENYVTTEHTMLELLANFGPLTVGVDATNWQNYQGGIIQYHCGDVTNHAVQIVGYDISGEIPYYIVRNSWGTDFGHDGYLYIKFGDNVCALARQVSTVYVL